MCNSGGDGRKSLPGPGLAYCRTGTARWPLGGRSVRVGVLGEGHLAGRHVEGRRRDIPADEVHLVDRHAGGLGHPGRAALDHQRRMGVLPLRRGRPGADHRDGVGDGLARHIHLVQGAVGAQHPGVVLLIAPHAPPGVLHALGQVERARSSDEIPFLDRITE